MRIFSYLTILFIILLGLTFASLNADLVTLDYYFGSKKISLSLLLVIFLGSGVLLGFLVALIPIIRLKTHNLQLKGQLKRLEKNSL